MKIAGFELLERLGGGGMAAVWKARQLSLDRIVAVKVLLPGRELDGRVVELFQREAQTAARLRHPGIIQVYDAGVYEGVYYFVMEHVAGYTVGQWVRRKEVLDEGDVLVLADCVAAALGYAWDRERMIHCDIKPDNIMIDADGTVKVADLGLARSMEAMSGSVYTEEVWGTPAYMSPEQASGHRDLDLRTDVYSLGAVMYHLATGSMLFEGETEDRIVELQAAGDPVAPERLNPALSNGMCRLIRTLLAKDRAQRPNDWGGVRREIAAVQQRSSHPGGARGARRGRSR